MELMRNNDFVSNAHCKYSLTYHTIFVTKFRRKCLTQCILSDLYQFLPLYASKIKVSIGEIKGEADHIHFILETSPADKLSSVIGALKCKSAAHLYDIGHTFPYWGRLKRCLWSSGYFVCSTGGVSIEVLEKYIRNQGTQS